MLTSADVGLIAECDQPGGGQLPDDPQIRAAVRSCTLPGSGPDTRGSRRPGRR
jgi:hypothetical protein